MKLLNVVFISIFSVSLLAQALPEKINCSQANSQYVLVLLLKSPQIPDGFTAFGLKKDTSVIFKTASQMFTDENNQLNFIEAPAKEPSKKVILNLQSKVATLQNFHLFDLDEGSQFNCQF